MKFIRFGYDEKGEYRELTAPKDCLYCSFASTKDISVDVIEFEHCIIEREIKKGNRVCPYNVIQQEAKIK